MQVIGIDPGKNGAYTIIENYTITAVVKFNQDINECRRLSEYRPDLFCIEHVSSSPKQGVVSAFTFGRYFEAALTAIYTTGIRTLLVRPNEWQSALGCCSEGKKSVLLARAKKSYPDAYAKKMFNLESADSVLIALYGFKYLVNNR